MSCRPPSVSIIRCVRISFVAVACALSRFPWRVKCRMICEINSSKQPVISVSFQEIRRSRMLKISVMQMLMITLASTVNAELTRQVSVARVLSNFPESWVSKVALAHTEQLMKNTAADAVTN